MGSSQTTSELAGSKEKAKSPPSGLPVLSGVLLAAGIAASLLGLLSSSAALVSGVALGTLVGNPLVSRTRSLTSRLLALSVMGLGAGMDLRVVGRVGLHGIGYTVVGITVALGAGLLLGRMLRTERNTSILLSAGTAICGGSAIAALAPVLRAEQHQVSVALGVVFLLNAVALVVFPPMGHVLDLSQVQFGLWSALATYVPALHSAAGAVSEGARRTLVATLFLIGANLTRDTLRTVGFRPLVQGVSLWAVVGTGTLGAILAGFIR